MLIQSIRSFHFSFHHSKTIHFKVPVLFVLTTYSLVNVNRATSPYTYCDVSSRGATPLHFNADTDSAYTFMRIQIQLFTLMCIRVQLLFRSDGIYDRWTIDPLILNFEPPGLHCERRPSTALFWASQAFDFNADPDPDPAFHCNVGPVPFDPWTRIRDPE